MTLEKELTLASCNNCNAGNYETPFRKDVSVIYRLTIGCMANNLCGECLKKLGGMIDITEVEL